MFVDPLGRKGWKAQAFQLLPNLNPNELQWGMNEAGKDNENTLIQMHRVGKLVTEEMRRLSSVGPGMWKEKMEVAHRDRELLRNLMKYYNHDPKLSKVKRSDIEDSGLVSKYSKEDAEDLVGFLGGMEAMYDYFGSVNAKERLDNPVSENFWTKDKGSKANSLITGFLIKLDQKYNLGAKTLEIYNRLLNDCGLQRDMENAGFPRYASGIEAMVSAYLLLKKEHSNYQWRAATTEEDVNGGGDLVGIGNNGKIVRVEVKSSNCIDCVEIHDLCNPEECEKLMYNNGRWNSDNWDRRQESLRVLMERARGRGNDNQMYWWIDIPSRKKATS